MGLELFGAGYQQRTGELKNHADVQAAFRANVPAEFQGNRNNTTGKITFPSKTPAFADGTNGTAPGPYPILPGLAHRRHMEQIHQLGPYFLYR